MESGPGPLRSCCLHVLCKHEGDLQLRPDGSPMIGTAGMCITVSNEVPLNKVNLCLLSRRVVLYMNISKYSIYAVYLTFGSFFKTAPVADFIMQISMLSFFTILFHLQ